ncbi:hypothetical protein [Paucibacter sp. Y2R2-4]|uniref:hypothetical protein n=1 Tax=Paucibacter sp. Y2R2-4 TaxID=2893553 RepID=UPI0021E3F99E|nr:hypothetical protein [Paucibacter sp. Y2R2-4]MCV2349312.1 hypothetical protein [Paucibacter sp. Y2R2-4]
MSEATRMPANLQENAWCWVRFELSDGTPSNWMPARRSGTCMETPGWRTPNVLQYGELIEKPLGATIAHEHAAELAELSVNAEALYQAYLRGKSERTAQEMPAKLTKEQHVAACKVLLRASGLDGTPQRMVDAMLAAAPQAQPVQAQVVPSVAENAKAFAKYLAECDDCAIVPDIAGSFNAGWTSAAAPQAEPQQAQGVPAGCVQVDRRDLFDAVRAAYVEGGTTDEADVAALWGDATDYARRNPVVQAMLDASKPQMPTVRPDWLDELEDRERLHAASDSEEDRQYAAGIRDAMTAYTLAAAPQADPAQAEGVPQQPEHQPIRTCAAAKELRAQIQTTCGGLLNTMSGLVEFIDGDELDQALTVLNGFLGELTALLQMLLRAEASGISLVGE